MMLPINLIFVLIAFLGNAFLSLFTLLKNPKSATNYLFFLFTTSLTIYLWVNYFATQQPSDIDAFFWIKWVMGIALIINLLFFLLVSTFPYSSLQISRKLFWIVILFTLIALPLVPLGLVFKSVKAYAASGEPGLGMPIFLLHTIIFLGGGFVELIRKFKKSSGIIKAQIRMFLLGAILMFFSILITNLLFVLILNTGSFIGLLPIYTLIFVGFISYAIVKHRFLDIGLIVARTVSYTLLVGLFGLLYALAFAFMSSFFVGIQIQTRAITTSTILALVMAFSFQPLRRLLERLTDRIFYKDHYDTQGLLYKLAQIMASTLRLEDLTSLLLRELLTQMRISRGAFILLEEGRVFHIIQEGYTSILQFDNQTVSNLLHENRILVFEELPEGAIKEVMRLKNITIAAYLRTKSEHVGLLILGGKLSGDIYSSEDIKVLEILASESSVAIENAKAYEKISRFNITLQEKVNQATRDLKIANQKLKELDLLKNDFVSIASHELRTPMTAIRSYAWMALHRADVVLTPKMEKYLIRVLLSTERLINLVNDMLNISRIESGRVEIKPEPVDLLSLCKDIVDEVYYSKSLEKKINFVILENPAPKVFADPDKLRQVFLNIVGNSLKFTPDNGSITFDFFSDGRTVEVSIKDTGIGISKDDISRLFTKFGKLDNSYVSVATSGGTGLGLYISKKLIELMHGRIWVYSEGLGKGSTFTFSLPVATKEVLEHADLYTIKPSGEVKELEPAAV